MRVEKLEKIPFYILLSFVFLLPLFTLPWTRNQTDLNKQMLTYLIIPIFGISLIIVNLLKKSPIRFSLLDGVVIAFGLSFLVSSFQTSGNRFEGLISQTMPILTLVALYVLIRQVENLNIKAILIIFTTAIALDQVIILIQQMTKATQIWYPSGSYFYTLWLSAIIIPVCFGLALLFWRDRKKDNLKNIIAVVYFIAIGLFLLISEYILLKPAIFPLPNTLSPIVLLSKETGWKILLGTLYQSPLVGIGPGNFIDSFTRFKPLEFNQTLFWNARFTSSSNVPFHLGTELGLLGLAAYIGLILFIGKLIINNYLKSDSLHKSLAVSIILMIILQFLAPASFIMIAVFLLLLAFFANSIQGTNNRPMTESIQVKNFLSQIFIIFPITTVSLILFFYMATNPYTAEVFAKRAADSLQKGDGIKTLENLDQAVKMAPYRENYYSTMSQVNRAIAANILDKNSSPSGQLSPQVTQQIQSLIKTAIDQNKKTTDLSPNRSAHWEQMAQLYRNVSGIVKDTGPWILSSYDKTIQNDPNNPRLYVDLGGIFFGDGEYATASALFKRAVDLKPDYNNAHYNLAHALFKLNYYQNAVNELTQAIALTKTSSQDLSRAKGELELFKSQLAKSLVGSTPSANPALTPTPNQSTASGSLQPPLQNERLNIASNSSLTATKSGSQTPIGGNSSQIPQ